MRWSSLAGALLLTAYGVVLTAAGALALAGVFGDVPAANVHALRWHALFWDPWFAPRGVAWLLAWRGSGLASMVADADNGRLRFPSGL